MRLLGVKTAYHLSCSKQPLFPKTETKFQAKHRMKGGWIQAEALYGDNYMFRKHSKKYPGKPLKFGRKSPGKEFYFIVGHPVLNVCNIVNRACLVANEKCHVRFFCEPDTVIKKPYLVHKP